MLLRFEAGNFLSFAETQELSLVASKLKGAERGLVSVPSMPSLRALPVALIYGANASGKTNFVKAFMFVKDSIIYSHRRGNPEGGIPRKPFLLDDNSKDQDSHFEVEFVVNNTRYVFGFTCNNKIFQSEWLYKFPEGKRRKLYERFGQNIEFGQSMKGQKKVLVDFMRENSLFISTATQNDHEELSEIVEFFRNVQYSDNLSVSESVVSGIFKEGEIDSRAIDFLHNSGSGIVDFEKHKKIVPDNIKKLNSEILALIKNNIGEDVVFESNDDGEDVEIKLVHKGSDKNYALPLTSESSGTRRLLLLLSKIIYSLDKGFLIIIDELDASLHTLIAEQIIELFVNPKYNVNGAQLIATTHDTNILACDNLRRDQIWFSEKSIFGSSCIYSLANFKIRPTDHFEKGYLEGRFGAIPYAGNLSAVLDIKSL